jgi:general secretion pathway protein K
LIIVLWMAALLALAAAALAASAKVHFQATRNSIESERAQWLADAGVKLALRGLVAAQANGTPRADAPARTCRLPEGDILTISIHDESGKIDLNTADDALIRALLTGVGVPEPEATKLLAAITDFRDADNERSIDGAEAPEYRAAARPAGPKNAPFDAVVEVGSVLGLSTDVFARIRPHLTVHSGQNGVDPAHAAADLLDILARANPDLGSTSVDEPRGTFLARGRLIPARFITASTSQAFTVHAEATTMSGTQVARAAIVTKLEGARPQVSSADGQPGLPPARRASSLSDPTSARQLFAYRIWQWDRAARSLERRAPQPNATFPAPC